ncbi:hypothetical protein [Lactiplantibacillus herbarum]|uniref:hypothetical protein n=1 Tax=Lactiplantibacillus herbarum TaxID=1670446 RepID=UPI00064E87F1|nr:hypothetical protein [Lactiplantibacillus herbarum]
MASRDSKAAIMASKRQLSLTSMKFNRFLLFRYVTAIIFFVNLYWLVLLAGLGRVMWLLPALLMVMAGTVMFEQAGKYWHPTNQLTLTKWYYGIQLSVNLALMVLVVSGQLSLVYPFLTNQAAVWLVIFLAVGTAICGLLERRIYLVEHDRDRYLQHIKQFAASL